VIMLIDANIYLDLFRMVAGRKLLAFLEEQQAHIFISQQIVHEVTRNKLNVAKNFFPDQFVAVSMKLPDHILGLNNQDIADLRHRLDQARQASEDLEKVAAKALRLIGLSEDDVSKRLAPLFQNAIQPSPDEMTRARSRKERGNPPGKPSGPLGDEIIWEQFLSYCVREKRARAWIVTRDGDYCTAF
jgi:hypothetical protein